MTQLLISADTRMAQYYRIDTDSDMDSEGDYGPYEPF